MIAIYAPNSKQEKFYCKLYKTILEKEYQNICILGDFNAIVDERLDYKNGKKGKGEGEDCQTFSSRWQKN